MVQGAKSGPPPNFPEVGIMDIDKAKTVLLYAAFAAAALAIVIAGIALAVLVSRTLGGWAGILLILSAATVTLAAIVLLKNESEDGYRNRH